MLDVLLIVVVLLLIFGASKVRSAGSDLGTAVKGFRKALQGPQSPPSPTQPGHPQPDAEFPEVLAERARKSGRTDA